MKKARSQKLKKFNKVLSVLLAAAMVAGSVPDVSLVAHATEAETEAELDIQDSENQDFEESGSDVQDNENAADADADAEVEEQTGSSEAEELEADESIQPAAENPDTDNQDTENMAENNTDSKAADTTANENTTGEEAEGEDGKAPRAAVTVTVNEAGEGTATITYCVNAEEKTTYDEIANVGDFKSANEAGLDSAEENQYLYVKVEAEEGTTVTVAASDDVTVGEAITKNEETAVYYKIQIKKAFTLTVTKESEAEDQTCTITVQYDNTIDSVTYGNESTPINREGTIDDATQGDTITFTITPDDGYTGVTVNGSADDVEEGSEGAFTYDYTVPTTETATITFAGTKTPEQPDPGPVTPDPDEAPEKKGNKISNISLKALTAADSASIGREDIIVNVEGNLSDGNSYENELKGDNGWKLSDLAAGSYAVVVSSESGVELTDVKVDGLASAVTPQKQGDSYAFKLTLDGTTANSIVISATAKKTIGDTMLWVDAETEQIIARVKEKGAKDSEYKAVSAEGVKIERNKSYTVEIAPNDTKTIKISNVSYPTGADVRKQDGKYYITFTCTGSVSLNVETTSTLTATNKLSLNADGSNSKLTVEYAQSDVQTANPQTLTYAKLDGTGKDLDSSAYAYVRVEKIDGIIEVEEDYGEKSAVKEDNKYLYYALGQMESDKAVTVTANVTITVTEDADRVQEIAINQAQVDNSEENQTSVFALGQDKLSQNKTYNSGDYDVVITMEEGAVLKSLVINGKTVSDITHSSTGANVYTAAKTVKSTESSDIQIKTAKQSTVTFVGTDAASATVKYGLNASKQETELPATSKIEYNGTLYFTLEAAENKAVTKVEALTLYADANGMYTDEDDIKSSKELTAANGVYSVDVAEDITIRVTTADAKTVTVDTEDANVTGYAWSLEQNTGFKEYKPADTATTPNKPEENPIPQLVAGTKLYLQFTVKAEYTESVKFNAAVIYPVAKVNGKNVYEVEIGETNAIVATAAQTASLDKATITFTGTKTDISKIEYKSHIDTDYKPLTIPAEAQDTSLVQAENLPYGEYDIKVTLTTEKGASSYVSTIGGKNADKNGVATITVNTETPSVAIATADFKTVTVNATTVAEVAKVEYKIGKDDQYKEVTPIASGETATDANKIKGLRVGDELYLKVTAAEGKKVSDITGATLETEGDDKGAYKLTVDASTEAVTIMTAVNTDKNVTFTVGEKKVVDTIQYAVGTTAPADWSSLDNSTYPVNGTADVSNRDKAEAAIADFSGPFGENHNVYFKLNLVDAAKNNVTTVMLGSKEIEANAQGVYTLENADIKALANIEVTINTTAIYTMTFNMEPDQSAPFTVNELPTINGETTTPGAVIANNNSKPVKAGEEYGFTVTYDTEAAKIDAVNYVITDDEGKEKSTPISFTVNTKAEDDTSKNETRTYKFTPTEAGTIKIKGHTMGTVTVNFDTVPSAGATIKAANTAAGVDTATDSTTATIKEDGTVYFKVTPADRYALSSVAYKDTDDEGEVTWTPLTAAEGIYSLELKDPDVNTDTQALSQTIRIVTVRDAAKNNAVTFDTNLDQVEVKYNTNVVLGGGTEDTIHTEESGKIVYTDAATLGFTVQQKPGFKVTGVRIGDEDQNIKASDFDTAVSFTVEDLANLAAVTDGAGKKEVTVTITTEQIALADEQTITFTNNGVVSYIVTTAGAECTSYNTYSLPKDTKNLEFAVVVRNHYVPDISYTNTAGDEVQVKAIGSPVKVSNDKTEYKYSIPAAAIDSEITLDSELEDGYTATAYAGTIKVVKAVENVAVTFEAKYDSDGYEDSINSLYLKNTTDENGNAVTTYTTINPNDEEDDGKTIEAGSNVVLYAKVAKNHTLTATGLEGFAYDHTEGNKLVYKAYIKDISADINAVITSAEANTITFTKNGNDVEPVKGKYAASKNDTFEVKILTGSHTGAFTEASASAKNVTFTEEDLKNENGVVTLTVPKGAAGKDITLNVSYEGGSEKYVISVAKDITAVTIKGNSKNEVKQTLDTTVKYTLTGTTDFSVLEVKPKENDNVIKSAVIDAVTGELVITTTKEAGSSEFTIISNADLVAAEEGAEPAPKTVATIKVTNDKAALAVKSVNTPVILDNVVTLELLADAKTIPVTGDTYLKYKVTVDPAASYKNDSTAPQGMIAKNTQYFDVVFKDGKAAASKEFVKLVNGAGKDWSYSVSVSLVQTTKDKDISDADVLNESAKVITKTVITKAPYYEDKLSLTKKTTTVYTGQKDVTVAIPKFAKGTFQQNINNAKVEVYDKNGRYADSDFINAWWDEDGTIKVNVGKTNLSNKGFLGAYTLKVIPDAGNTTDETSNNMYAAPATLKITVVQGIETISAVSGNIYKDTSSAKPKAVTFNMNTTLNGGSKDYKPKTNKLVYEVGKVNAGGVFETDAAIARYVSVKNGKITIAKDYPIKADVKENQFTVKVSAADYAGSTVSGKFTYIVTNEKPVYGGLYFAKYDYNRGYYMVADGTSFTTDEFETLMPIVLKSGVESGRSYYTDDDLVWGWSISYSNKKITANYASHTIANKVTATVTALDGSKVTAKTMFALVYNKQQLGINEFNAGSNDTANTLGGTKKVGIVKKSATEYEFNANSADDTIIFNVGYLKDSDAKTYTNLGGNAYSGVTFNYTVGVKGGKILTSDKYYGSYTVLPTAEKMTITLTNKSSGKVETKYNFTNKAFANSKVKAPTVKVSQGNIYVGKSNYVDIKVTGNTAYDYMYISVDAKDYAAEQTKKTSGKANRVAGYYNLESFVDVDRDGTPDIYKNVDYAYPVNTTAAKGTATYDFSFYAEPESAAGTYKYNVTFGTKNADGEFVPATKAVPIKVTVKAAAAFKPAAKYTIDSNVGYVQLTGTPVEYASGAYSASYVELENANIGGQKNKFLEYFSLDKANGRIVMNMKDANNTLYDPSEINKNDCIGYVTYYDAKTATVQKAKITISFKANVYKASNIDQMLDKDNKLAGAVTTVTNGKNPVNVAFAAVEAVKDGTFTVESCGGNRVSIAATGLEPGKSYKVNLYVVEANANAAKKIANLSNNSAQIKEIGGKMTLTVKAANPKKGLIKFDKAALTQVFTANDYVQGSQDFVYEKSVPYTTAVKGAEVSKVTLDSSAPAYFGIKKIDGNSRVLITVKKKALAEADAANAAASRKPKSLYKATSTVKATVEYTTGLTETISFKLTTPEKPQTYAEALAVIKAAEKDALAVMTYTNNDFKEDIEADIAAKANALINKDSGASVTVKTVGDIVRATKEADGYVNAKLTVTNTESGATENPYESVARQWAVKMTKADITTLDQAGKAVSEALDKVYSGKIQNGVTEDAVLAVVKQALTDGKADARIDVRIQGFEYTPATVKAVGNLNFTVKLSRSIWKSVKVNRSYRIEKLNDATGAKTAIIAEFEKQFSTADSKLDNMVTADDILAAAEAVKYNPDLKIAFGPEKETAGENEVTVNKHFHKTDATTAANGYVEGTLIITNEKDATDKAEVKLGQTKGTDNVDVAVVIKQYADADATTASAIKTYLENTANFKALNTTDKEAVIEAARKAINDPEKKLTIAVKPDEPADADGKVKTYFELKPATVKAAGQIKVTLNISSEKVTTPVPTEITMTIEKLPQSIAALAAEADKVLKDAEQFKADNNTTAAVIKTALGNVIDSTSFEIYDKTGKKDNVTLEKATAEAAGSLEFTLRFKADTGAEDEVTYTFEIEKLAQ